MIWFSLGEVVVLVSMGEEEPKNGLGPFGFSLRRQKKGTLKKDGRPLSALRSFWLNRMIFHEDLISHLQSSHAETHRKEHELC